MMVMKSSRRKTNPSIRNCPGAGRPSCTESFSSASRDGQLSTKLETGTLEHMNVKGFSGYKSAQKREPYSIKASNTNKYVAVYPPLYVGVEELQHADLQREVLLKISGQSFHKLLRTVTIRCNLKGIVNLYLRYLYL